MQGPSPWALATDQRGPPKDPSGKWRSFRWADGGQSRAEGGRASQNHSSRPPETSDKDHNLDKPRSLQGLEPSPPPPGAKSSRLQNSPGDKHAGKVTARGGGLFFVLFFLLSWFFCFVLFYPLLVPHGVPWFSTFQHRTHTGCFPRASQALSPWKAETHFFFQASFSGNFTSAIRKGNTQTFHFHFFVLQSG